MATTPYPLPRDTRESGELFGNGGTTYGPFGFKIFDVEDVRAYVKPEGAEEYALAPATVRKVTGAEFDHFTIQFMEPIPPTSRFKVVSARLHARETAVTKGGSIAAQELEKELSKQGSILDELRRDVDIAGDLVVASSRAQAASSRAQAAARQAEAARAIAAGYASDAVSQGNVPIYASIDGMSAVEIPAGINCIRVNGKSEAGDGEGGLFVDDDNGRPAAFSSGGTTARNWYPADDSIGFAIWDSGTYRRLQDRSKRIAHLDDFSGADPTGRNTSHDAMQVWLQQAAQAKVEAVAPAGNFAIEESLGRFESIYLRGAGNGFWRANPFAFFDQDATQDHFVTRIILVGTGPKTINDIDFITASRQCGFDRDVEDIGLTRTYNNALDKEILLWDCTNADAVGTTPATLRSFSAALEIAVPHAYARKSSIKDIMIVPNCPTGIDSAVGIRGYGKLNAVVPFADWDFGLVLRNVSMTEIENVNVVGYYRERGVLILPGAVGVPTEGQGEHVHWRGGYIQGGVAIRSGDNWPVVAKTSDTLDVRWTPSHRFSPTGGTLRFNTGGSTTYTGLQFIPGSPDILRFIGVASTSDVTAGSTSISTTSNAGISHTKFSDMYLADQGYASRIEGPNPALGYQATPYRAALEASGDPCRALKLENVTPMVSGPVAFHLGRAPNVEFNQVYTEPKTWKLSPDGSSFTGGALFVAGPKGDMIAEVGSNNLPSITMTGVDMTGSVSMAPLWPATSGRMMGVTDVFNTRYAFNERRERGLSISAINNSPDLYFVGPNNRNVGLFARSETGERLRCVARFAQSGNVIIGDPSRVTLFGGTGTFAPGTDGEQNLGSFSGKWHTVYAATGTIHTSDENQKQQIERIPDEWLDAWGDVEYVRYKWIDAVAKKGDDARWHIGLVAQRVRDAFLARGIDPFAIGLLCYDEWDEQEEISQTLFDEDGNVIKKEVEAPYRAAGSTYGIRYEEALALEAAWQRRELQRLKLLLEPVVGG